MTHEPESEYAQRIVEALEDAYGDGNVDTGVHLPATGRYADIVVYTDAGDPLWVAEVENDFEAAFKGIGQALLYGQELECMAFVFVPPGHVDVPEVLYLERSSDVRVVQFPVEDEH